MDDGSDCVGDHRFAVAVGDLCRLFDVAINACDERASGNQQACQDLKAQLIQMRLDLVRLLDDLNGRWEPSAGDPLQ